MEPFYDSIASLPLKENEEIGRVKSSGISKKSITFVFETLEVINSRETAEREASLDQVEITHTDSESDKPSKYAIYGFPI